MEKVNVVNEVTTKPGLPASPFGQTGSPQITVPAGQHLVVETLSVQLDVTPPGSKLEALVTYLSGGANVILFCAPDVCIHRYLNRLRFLCRYAGSPLVRGPRHGSHCKRCRSR